MKNRIIKILGIGAVSAMSALTLFGCGQPAQTEDTDITQLSSENENPNTTSDDGYETYISEDGNSATIVESDSDSDSDPSSDATEGLDANTIDITGLTDSDDADASSTNIFETTPSNITEESSSSGNSTSIDLSSSVPE